MSNRAVVFKGERQVAIESFDDPKLEMPDGQPAPHGAIIKLLGTNICGSDQHMTRARTAAKPGLRLGHEVTGIIVELGSAVAGLKKGDIITVPFNIACGTCSSCKKGLTNLCVRANEGGFGAAYGYVALGWDNHGVQAEYAFIPWVMTNSRVIPNTDEAKAKMVDMCMLSDIFPTGFAGAVRSGVGPGKSVYVAGCGPVGLAALESCRILGAGPIFAADKIPERLKQAATIDRVIPIDISTADETPIAEQVRKVTGSPYVDCFVDAVGFEASGHGAQSSSEHAATVLNAGFDLLGVGGMLSAPGLYVPEDPGGKGDAAKGILGVAIGLGWAKACGLCTGQTAVLQWNELLMNSILFGGANIAKAVNAEIISLEDAPQGYTDFDGGKSVKYVIDPHGELTKMVAG